MIQARRAIGILTSVVVACAGVVVVQTHAADEPDRVAAQPGVQPPASRPPASQSPAATPSGARSPSVPNPSVAQAPSAPNPKAPTAKSPAPGAPQVPEESATIRDDPTIAPDPKQSADNNVSFPNDI